MSPVTSGSSVWKKARVPSRELPLQIAMASPFVAGRTGADQGRGARVALVDVQPRRVGVGCHELLVRLEEDARAVGRRTHELRQVRAVPTGGTLRDQVDRRAEPLVHVASPPGPCRRRRATRWSGRRPGHPPARSRRTRRCATRCRRSRASVVLPPVRSYTSKQGRMNRGGSEVSGHAPSVSPATSDVPGVEEDTGPVQRDAPEQRRLAAVPAVRADRDMGGGAIRALVDVAEGVGVAAHERLGGREEDPRAVDRRGVEEGVRRLRCRRPGPSICAWSSSRCARTRPWPSRCRR